MKLIEGRSFSATPGLGKSMVGDITNYPLVNLQKRTGTSPFIVSFPMDNDDFPQFFLRLTGTSWDETNKKLLGLTL